MNLIRKISIGRDYKNDAMHYSVGQEVFGGHTITEIIEDQGEYKIYINNEDETLPWKHFIKNLAIAVEYDLQY